MSGREEPLGAILSGVGALSRLELAELVELQRAGMPLGSLCYVLGLCDEETLARALAVQLGIPAVVLDRSVIALEVLDGAAPELALENKILPLAEERHRLLVACERPAAVRDVLREMEFIKGKPVVAHVALKVTLERTLRACLRAHARGQAVLAGPAAGAPVAGVRGIFVVPERAERAVAAPEIDDDLSTSEDTEIEPSAELLQAVLSEADLAEAVDGVGTTTEPTAVPIEPPADGGTMPLAAAESGKLPLVSPDTAVSQIARRGGDPIEILDLDGRDGTEYRPFRGGRGRVLVVDDDFASRQFLAKELGATGYDVMTAEHGGEAVARITGDPPDAIVVDIMLPEIDGFHICRAVKQSEKYSGIAVVLISAVIDSGRVTDDVLRRYGADAYFEKPIRVEDLRERLAELMAARGAGDGRGRDSFERAMSLYRAGDIDAAVGELRLGIEEDPSSARHHFVLANILHKKSLIIEAIDEYEATLEIRPDYFPALTRLAYLYYRQGYASRAIDTWRRSLPLCADPALRHNIEQFMRKLIGEVGEQ